MVTNWPPCISALTLQSTLIVYHICPVWIDRSFISPGLRLMGTPATHSCIIDLCFLSVSQRGIKCTWKFNPTLLGFTESLWISRSHMDLPECQGAEKMGEYIVTKQWVIISAMQSVWQLLCFECCLNIQ